VPATTYRISYRPVSTVVYMPVVGIDPRSGCAVTTYRPARTWSYQASLVPYQAGYTPVAAGACGSCSGCAPCSGYSSPCGGCSACGTSYGGCSSCTTGVSSGYVASSGCSSCAAGPAPLAGTLLPGPGDMSRPPLASSPSTAAQAPVTIGAPRAAPLGAPPEVPKTYAAPAPGAPAAPISPSAPAAGGSSSGTMYRLPAPSDGNQAVEPPTIQGVPPLPSPPSGPQLTPSPRPDNEKTTARPVLQATYFQLLPSPPATVPAQLISAPERAAPQHVEIDWHHADN
jgi:hypothetical protein